MVSDRCQRFLGVSNYLFLLWAYLMNAIQKLVFFKLYTMYLHFYLKQMFFISHMIFMILVFLQKLRRVEAWNIHVHIAPAYGVYISQLIRYSKLVVPIIISFIEGCLLTRQLLNQGFLLVTLNSSLRKCNGGHHDLVDHMEYMCHKLPRICSTCFRFINNNICMILFPNTKIFKYYIKYIFWSYFSCNLPNFSGGLAEALGC